MSFGNIKEKKHSSLSVLCLSADLWPWQGNRMVMQHIRMLSVPEGRRLTEKKPWQKIIIMLAGVFNNFVLAYLIFSFVLLGNADFHRITESCCDTVVEGSPAEQAGFQAGDIIKKIVKEDGSSVEPDNYIDMQAFSANYSGVETYTWNVTEKTDIDRDTGI
jgi:membrane-associated protease RseP (regulator of RpoE activity)